MRNLHPCKLEPVLPEHLSQAARINESLTVNVLKSFKKGAVGSLTGLRPQHVIDVLDVLLYTPIIISLANLLNLMVGGLACEEVRPYLVGAKCFALIKERDAADKVSAVHWVANGNFEWKWVSKCLTRLDGGTLSRKLVPECMEIGVPCATEFVVHIIRKHWGAAPTDWNTFLLWVDASNV
eukprot:TRINITY_DN2408_c0_g3_i1.p1 TRINITY_DN2408_c0_g3~~TRINITY_DN2408_c0_g3_i1.p1  ORF type:complete len:181 (+),score=27.11 TRINITY_DN2408_c0_g3_i1:751-1293(+)